MNYVALGCIAEFDDAWHEPYTIWPIGKLTDDYEIEIVNFRKDKYIIKDWEKLSKLMVLNDKWLE